MRKIIRSVESYLAYSEGQDNDGHANVPMANLKKMCGGAFSLHYVLILAVSSLLQQLIDDFVMQLESFLFYYIYTKTPTKELAAGSLTARSKGRSASSNGVSYGSIVSHRCRMFRVELLGFRPRPSN